MTHEGTAARPLPQPTEQTAEVRDLRASLRLLRQGKISGYVDCMMHYRPRRTEQTPDQLAALRAEYTKIAEAKYPEIGR
jgi:hypothetical protein